MPTMIRASKKVRAIAAKILGIPEIKKVTPVYRPDITMTKSYEAIRKMI